MFIQCQRDKLKLVLTGQQVTLLRKRLDSLSMGVNQSREVPGKIRKDYRSILSSTGNCSSRRTDAAEQGASRENKLCSKRFKDTIKKIAEQVHAETEQWFQVQELLHHVREEMEDLQKSRNFWEDHALHAVEKIHDWRRRARLSEIKISELQSEAAQLRNEIELVRHRHAIEQTRWLDAHSRYRTELSTSNSVRSSIEISDMHLEGLDHREASVTGAETSNLPANVDKAAYPDEDENWNEKKHSETKYMKMIKPKISNAALKSHVCSHKNSIKYASKLCELHSNQQSWSKHHQQKDCVTEQLPQKRTKRRIQAAHSKENIPLQKTEIRNPRSIESGQSSTTILGTMN